MRGETLRPHRVMEYQVCSLLVHVLLFACQIPLHVQSRDVYHNVWTVHVDGESSDAERIAGEHGLINHGQVGSLQDHYAFTHPGVAAWAEKPSNEVSKDLRQDPQVLMAEQQVVRKRIKRDVTTSSTERTIRHKRALFNDRMWPQQWYLKDSGDNLDMNIIQAWRRGYTGNGVVVTILDDGIEYTHDDLKDNYDAAASWDVNANDSDPLPRYEAEDVNRHGTRCAGEVAATANNTKCIVGVAYESRVGGVRMLDGPVTDLVEAAALSLNPHHIDIYSSSWGPSDDGNAVEGPGNLAIKALIKGVQQGRNGRGSIFVWASGNGGAYGDSCACDGYAGSIFTITVSSATERGLVPYYAEQCSGILTTTLSSGDEREGDRSVLTTTTRNACAVDHTGTSASAPIAAGIIALTLQANMNLTWRDVQHIIVRTSRWRPLVDGNWVKNGAGMRVSQKYGFGLIDADAMVRVATNWTTVPEHRICIHRVVVNRKRWKPFRQYTIRSTGCSDGRRGCPVRYAEHVQLKIQLAYPTRGEVHIHVTSPQGTRSTLLARRSHDHASTRFYRSPFGVFWRWPLMSTHFWGEDPRGVWTVGLYNTDAVGEIQLIVHGTWRHPYPESIAHHQTEASCRHIDMVDLFTSSIFKRAPFRFVKNVEDVLRYSNKSSPKVTVSKSGDLSLMIALPVCLLLYLVLVTIGVCKRLRLGPCQQRSEHLCDEEGMDDAIFIVNDESARPLYDVTSDESARPLYDVTNHESAPALYDITNDADTNC